MHLNRFSLLIAVSMALMLSGNIFSQTFSAALTHCHDDERVQFSCRVGAKIVSLCGGGTDGRLTSLTYRYGVIKKVEKEFTALPGNALRFSGAVGPYSPGASVEQICFNQKNTQYLITSCVGGNCPKYAGLAVLRGTRILMNKSCKQFAADDFGSVSQDLVRFGSGIESTQSATEMLIIEDHGTNDIHKLFPVREQPLW